MKHQVRLILQKTACLDVPVESLADSDDLYAAGLSSLGTVRVMMAIEDHFAIELPNELITHDMFQSVDSLAGVLVQIVPEESIAQRT